MIKRDRKRGGLDDTEEEQEINGQIVLIRQDIRLSDTFDEEMTYAEHSSLHQSDRDFQRTFRYEIDKNGGLVGADKDQLLEDENENERRRTELLDWMKLYDNESVHSHETLTHLEGDWIAIQKPRVALLGNEESMDEQDIVYCCSIMKPCFWSGI